MAVDPVASRYAQALFESAKAEGRLDEALAHMQGLAQLLIKVADLHQFILNPDVDPPQKLGVLDRALNGAWSPLVKAFVELTIRAGRAELFGGITEALEALVDDDRGRMRATVRSAHPLEAAQVKRLQLALERREAKAVALAVEVDPELIGGVQVRLDHRLIDGSVRRQLADLRDRLKSARHFAGSNS